MVRTASSDIGQTVQATPSLRAKSMVTTISDSPLRSPSSYSLMISVVMSASLGGFLFLTTLYLQGVRGFSPLRAGLMIIPMAVGQVVAAIVSGRLVASRGPRPSLALGGALLAAGGFLFVSLSAHTQNAYLLITYVVFGLGAGMISPPVTASPTATLLSGIVPADRSSPAVPSGSTFSM